MSTEPGAAGTVIVGAGQAGGDLAFFLRQHKYGGRITLLGGEAYVPYRRPPLSKAYLAGEVTLESLYLRSVPAYREHRIDFRTGTQVAAIDRAAREVRLGDGNVVPYEALVLATGGQARRLPLPGADAANVHYVRTIADIEKLRGQFTAGRRLVVIGGGYIGLEAASVGIKKGLQVTVVEALTRVLGRVTSPEMSAFYERAHRSRGVDLRTGVGIRELLGHGHVDGVVLDDGTHLAADLIIVGIGLAPSTELAAAAGLEVANGVVVDEYLRTADPDVYAIGDCSNHLHPFYGRRLRLESVPNATEQARACAASICGTPTIHAAVPWFWSDQYDLKLQMAGLSEGYDRVVLRGDMATESFCAFYLRDGVLTAVDAVNSAAEFMVARRLIAQRARVAADDLANEGTPLRTLVQAAA